MALQGSVPIPVVRIALASARAAGCPATRRTGLHEVTRACRGSGRASSAGTGSALPAIRFGGVPVFLIPAASARPLDCAPASHSLARPFKARRESDAGPRRPATPSWASLPYSACSAAGSVTAGLKPCPPPSALSVSTLSAACTPLYLPGLFHPGNAPGVPSSGPCSAREARRLSRGRCSPAVRPTGPAPFPLAEVLDERATRGSRAFFFPGIRTAGSENRPRPLPS